MDIVAVMLYSSGKTCFYKLDTTVTLLLHNEAQKAKLEIWWKDLDTGNSQTKQMSFIIVTKLYGESFFQRKQFYKTKSSATL